MGIFDLLKPGLYNILSILLCRERTKIHVLYLIDWLHLKLRKRKTIYFLMFLKAKLILKATLNKLTEIMSSNEYNGKCVLRKQVTV